MQTAAWMPYLYSELSESWLTTILRMIVLMRTAIMLQAITRTYKFTLTND